MQETPSFSIRHFQLSSFIQEREETVHYSPEFWYFFLKYCSLSPLRLQGPGTNIPDERALSPRLRQDGAGRGLVRIRDYAEQVTNIFPFNSQMIL